ncbi:hypothetical protein [Agrobacterium radiobacter]|uniref:hypothetical protein n=1 Tax=Agrobacterium radiobacter TaxID=362 RepID=UPI003F849DBB
MKLESRHPDSLQACRCLQHIQLGRIIEDAPDQHNIFRTVYAEAIMWSEMPIGKYMGKTLPQLLLTDPDYFFWAMEQDDFFRGGLAKRQPTSSVTPAASRSPNRIPLTGASSIF